MWTATNKTVGLDWGFEEQGPAIHVDDHEKSRTERQARRRRGLESLMWLSPQRRRRIIENSTSNREEVMQARNDINSIRKGRLWSLLYVSPTSALQLIPSECCRSSRRLFRAWLENRGLKSFAHWSHAMPAEHRDVVAAVG